MRGLSWFAVVDADEEHVIVGRDGGALLITLGLSLYDFSRRH
jgi:hypothetical protein